MNAVIEQIKQAVSQFSPNLFGALLVLVVGWIIALIAAAIMRQVLRRGQIDNKVTRWVAGEETSPNLPVEERAGKGVFYIVMLFALVAFFYALKLPVLSDPLNLIISGISAYLPRILAAGLLLLTAWVLAAVFKRVVAAALRKSKLDESLGRVVGAEERGETSLSQTLPEVVYWLVFLLFVPAILGALGMTALLDPIVAMFTKFFAYLPQILGAAMILLVGWFVARIIRRIVVVLLVSAGADAASEKWGLAKNLGKLKLSGLIALIVYYVILLPVAVSALNALQLDAITKPASDMLAKITNMLPAIFGGMLLVAISFVAGRFVAGIVSSVLAGIGFNNVLVKLELAKHAREDDRSTSALAGRFVFVVVLLLASIEAANLLGFTILAGLIRDFIAWGGGVLLGLIIFGFGLLLANWVGGVVRSSDAPQAPLLANVARVVILVLAGAMALRRMSIANEIVNLAFGLLLGAVALAAAIAFGLGGRASAASLIEEWKASNRNKPSGS